MNTLKAALAEARREREEWQRAHDDMTERWREQKAELAEARRERDLYFTGLGDWKEMCERAHAALAEYRGALERAKAVALVERDESDAAAMALINDLYAIIDAALASPAGQAWLEWGREVVLMLHGMVAIFWQTDRAAAVEWTERARALLARAPEGVKGMSRTRDKDSLALQRACQAIEGSTSAQMIAASLRFMWDRYIVHPPATAWWAWPDAKRPKRQRRSRG